VIFLGFLALLFVGLYFAAKSYIDSLEPRVGIRVVRRTSNVRWSRKYPSIDDRPH
jgi:hypothetical protein